MSDGVLRYLVTGAFGMHGLGMLGAAGYMGFDKSGTMVGRSWLLGSGSAALAVGIPLWAAAGIGYVAAAYAFWIDAGWWQTAAAVGAAATVVAVVLWAGKIAPGVYAGGVLAVGTILWLAIR